MSYPRRVARLNLTGITTDLPTWKTPPNQWTGGNNVVARNGAISRIAGYDSGILPVDDTATFQPTDTPLRAACQIAGFGAAWFYADEAKQYRWEIDDVLNSSQDVTISGGYSTGSLRRRYVHSLFVFNNLVVHNARTTDGPMYYNTSITPPFKFTPMTGWSSLTADLAEIVTGLRNHLVALNFRDAGQGDLVQWSDAMLPAQPPSTWVAAADNDAGSAQLADTEGDITDAQKLGERLVIYKPRASWLMEYIGGNDVYAFRPLFSNLGALAPGCAVDINNRHAVLTPNDLLIHDGVSVESIVRRKVRSTIFSRIREREVEKKNSFLFYNRKAQELWVMIVEEGSGEEAATFAAVYNLVSGEWTFRDLPNPVSDVSLGLAYTESSRDATDNVLHEETDIVAWCFDGSDDYVHVMDTDTEVSLSASLERHDLDFDDSQRLKFVRAIHVQYQGTTDLEMRVGHRNDLTDSITWQAWGDITSAPTHCNVLGRYISFEIRSVDSTDVWTIAGVNIEYELRGYH